MRLIRINSDFEVIDYIHRLIKLRLENNNKVLWLISGGSAIKVEAEVARRLNKSNEIYKLTVMLVDERYGKPGHQNSNWHKLMQAGFWVPGAQLEPILVGKNIAQTTIDFAGQLHSQLATCDFKIGVFGMGVDGHTAGILPNSPAISSSLYGVHYRAGEFHRITCTTKAIENLDEAILYAVGKEKSIMLSKLAEDVDEQVQPAQILKKAAVLTVFNDQRGDIYEDRI
ncbi:6-phosphogluconolactonase [Candidatus Saccharibacteria bacterium]|nr:6-phosphogluconolactonase [Candidatus Saccharibacteria bacterium]